MHPLILQAVKEIESLRGVAQVSPWDKMSRVYGFLLRCERGMRTSNNPVDYKAYEEYFDKAFRQLENLGVAPGGPDV